MSADIILTLKAKIDALNKQKSSIDAEIAEINQALNVIGKYSIEGDFLSPSQVLMRLAAGKVKTKQQQILEGAALALAGGIRLHTSELLEVLKERGIEIGGEKPEANLSAYLSKSEDFENDRRFGWSLINKNAPGAATQGASTVNDLLS